MKRYLPLLLLCWLPGPGLASPLKVAVAANFSPTLEKIAARYASDTGQEISISTASTGTIFAQIINGATYDLFLAADVERPSRLERRDITRARFTYAVGRLVLWVPGARSTVDEAWLKGFRGRLAVANPALAPYGAAAVQTLEYFGARPGQLIRGANVAQTFQFVDSGSVDAGFVALSQLRALGTAPARDYWLVPTHAYRPVEQQLVVMRSAPPAADDFAAFLRSSAVRGMIAADGYLLATP